MTKQRPCVSLVSSLMVSLLGLLSLGGDDPNSKQTKPTGPPSAYFQRKSRPERPQPAPADKDKQVAQPPAEDQYEESSADIQAKMEVLEREKSLLAERLRLKQEKEKEQKELDQRIEKYLAQYANIQPPPPWEAPEPPPHEGAMVSIPPYVVEPPDLIVVEVLEALPGRPISGERLVRPDGTISLDFYGRLPVRGLTTDQIKTKVILHLRKYLNDEVLGLIEEDPDTGQMVPVPPGDSDRVYVDVTAYNSKVYFVQGDVMAAGRLPFTGNETVLDALNYAGGLHSVADPKNIRLCRPAHGKQAAREFRIDWEAIHRGDRTANLQILPGDRLVVGRHPLSDTAVQIDRLTAP